MEKVYILKGSDDNSYCVFGAFSSYDKAVENKQKLDEVDWVTDTEVKTDIIEVKIDDAYLTECTNMEIRRRINMNNKYFLFLDKKIKISDCIESIEGKYDIYINMDDL